MKKKVAVIQLTSVLDYKENLDKLSLFLREAKDQKAEIAFLPECFYSMSNGVDPSPFQVHRENEHFDNIRALAKKHQIYLIGGTAATSFKRGSINRAYNFDPDGADLGHYDKVHLFSCDFKTPKGEHKKIDEGDIYIPGNESKLIEADEIKIGLGVCFDLRFAEMAAEYKAKGAQVLTYSSAFTVPTGKAHWEVLLRARAIENQCFVIASAQWGRNNENISTYGHSMVIDPWGKVLANAEEGEKVICTTIDLSQIEKVQKSVIMGRSSL
jgi:predicted amidohydrolase